jgi:hypothetical protein
MTCSGIQILHPRIKIHEKEPLSNKQLPLQNRSCRSISKAGQDAAFMGWFSSFGFSLVGHDVKITMLVGAWWRQKKLFQTVQFYQTGLFYLYFSQLGPLWYFISCQVFHHDHQTIHSRNYVTKNLTFCHIFQI